MPMKTFALCGARTLIDGELQAGRAIVVDGGLISRVIDEAAIPAHVPIRQLSGGVLAPGFIDTQVNGGGGVLFNDDPSVDAIRRIGRAHRRFGTTGYLPTLISDSIGVVRRALSAVQQAIEEEVPGVLGVHLEGPMLSPGRAGIHDPDRFIGPEAELLDLVCSPRRGVTVVTLAPERVPTEVIARLTDSGVVVSLGHTNATYEEMRAGLDAGARGITHLFNAMSALTSRAPGALGAALEDRESWCGVIADCVHVHPAALRLAFRARGADRFMLVTDAMPPVGSDQRSFVLQERTIEVADGHCVSADGTLAGSALDMATAVRNCVTQVGLSLPAALAAASETPAGFLRQTMQRGRIAEGFAADIVWLDDDVRVHETWIAGVPANPQKTRTRPFNMEWSR